MSSATKWHLLEQKQEGKFASPSHIRVQSLFLSPNEIIDSVICIQRLKDAVQGSGS